MHEHILQSVSLLFISAFNMQSEKYLHLFTLDEAVKLSESSQI